MTRTRTIAGAAALSLVSVMATSPTDAVDWMNWYRLPATAFLETPFDAALLPPSQIPLLEMATLVANSVNAFRTLVPANELSGVAQIRALVGHTNFEEQWAYLPEISLWIEIGKNESASERDSQVEVDIDYLNKIVGLYDEVHIVHFHPATFYANGSWEHQLLPVEFPADKIALDDIQPIGFALPSPTDVLSSIQMSEILFAQNPDASIRFSVVSPHGLVTYGPTALGLRKILYEGGNPRATVARSIVTRLAVRRMAFNIERTIEALDSPSIGDVIEALCTQSSDENYRLTFSPFGDDPWRLADASPSADWGAKE